MTLNYNKAEEKREGVNMNESTLKTNKELIEDCIKVLKELPPDEVIKFLYMAKGVAVVKRNKTA